MKHIFSATIAILPILAFGQCNEIFISEYVEGWGNNKAIEVYNPTDQAVNLCNYQLERYANGVTDLEDLSFPNTVQLEGLLQPQDVMVFVVDKQDPDGVDFESPVWDGLAAVADVWLCPDYAENATMHFNGNDALLLRNLVNNEAVDIFGRIGEDPGPPGWASMTQNHTLIRKYSIGAGDTNGTDDFLVVDEWEGIAWVEPVNEGEVFGNLGQHDCLCDATVENGCTNSEACNYNPNALTNDGTCLFAGDPCDDCCESGIGTFTQSCQCVSGCDAGEDGLLCEESVPTSAPMHPFISEYVDHWFLTNAIELFNPTSNSIDLSDYSLQMYSNGNPFITDELQLNGLLEPFDTWVIVNGSTEVVGCIEEWDGEIVCTYEVFPELQEYADQFGIGVPPSPMFFDGDDALVLFHGPTMTQVDIFGKIGQDPGEGWTDNAETGYVGIGNVLTTLNTLRRKPNVSQGVQNNPDEFNALEEWSVEGNGAFTGLGHHEYCFVNNIFGCTSSDACNYNFDATDSDGSCYFPGDPCDDGDASTSNDMYNDSCECEGESAIAGCVNPNACNYNPEAVESDGSCYFPGDPCDDGDATTSNDMYNDSCECEGESAVTGCINPNACNYNADAVESDGSCLFPGDPCDDGDESTANDMYNDACECLGEEPNGTQEQILDIAIFPNPVNGRLSIELKPGLPAAIALFDPVGRIMSTWNTIGSMNLDLRHLPPGQYIISVQPQFGPVRNERISVLSN